MKLNLLSLLSFLLIAICSKTYAALPPGSPAPNFTITDINGNTHTLYDYLDQGKAVIMNMSATWCGPCWNYHNTHTLKNFYNQYGPPGTDQVMVFHVESDLNTNLDCLYGLSTCQGGTMGDWVAGTPYPIFNLTASNGAHIRSDYGLSYYPTIYAISPDRRAWEVGQAQLWKLESWVFQSFSLEVSVSTTDSYCGDNGTATAMSQGGYQNVNYLWSTGQSGSSINNLPPGTFNVRATDANGYFVEESFTVGGSLTGEELTVDQIDLVNVLCNGEHTGSVGAIASGGNLGYQYEWSNGVSGSHIYNVPAGYYIVTVTDAQGCTATGNFEITQPPPVIGLAYPIDATCDNYNGQVELLGMGGVAPYEFDLGYGYSSNTYYDNLAPGNYIFSTRDYNQCEFQSAFTISAIGIPIAQATADEDLDCEVTQVTVSGAGSSTGSNISYSWSTPDGNIVSGENQLNCVVDQAGTYILTVSNNQYDCHRTASAMVEAVVEAPTINIEEHDNLNCIITTVVLSAEGSSSGEDFEIVWTTEDGTIISDNDELEIEVGSPGTYTLTITNLVNGCSSSEDVVVTLDDSLPTASTEDALLTCQSSEVQICVETDENNSIVWYIDDDEYEGTCASVSRAGVYSAVVTGVNGCATEVSATVVADDSIPDVEIETSGDLDCVVRSSTITAEVTQEGEFTFEWSTENGQIISGADSSTVVAGAGGTYQLTVTNIDNGCIALLTVTVEDNSVEPMADFSYTLSNGILTLINNSNLTSGTIHWSIDDSLQFDGNEIDVNLGVTGFYNICLNVENECGGDFVCEELLYISKLQSSSSVQHISCFGVNDGSVSIKPEGGLPEYTIQWVENPEFSDSFQLNGLGPGIYTYLITDMAGNEQIDSVEIIEPSKIKIDAEVVNVSCYGDNDGRIELIAEGGTGELMADWPEIENGEPVNLAAGSYMVIVTDENNCQESATFEISQPEEIQLASVQVSESTNNESNGSIEIDVTGGSGTYSATWSNGLTGFFIEGLEAGEYFVTITDEAECSKVFGPIEVKSITSVKDIDQLISLSIFPNPTVDILSLKMELIQTRDISIRIRDFKGSLVSERLIVGKSFNEHVDVSNFTPGIYTLEVFTGETIGVEKFIVIK